MNKEGLKIALFGYGAGGISCADRLLKAGHSVTVFNPSQEPNINGRSVFSTEHGIYRDVMGEYCPDEYRLPIHNMRIITHTGTDFIVPLGSEYFMVDYPSFTDTWRASLSEHQNMHSEIHPRKTINDMLIWEDNQGVWVRLYGGYQQYDAVVDSSGVGSEHVKKVDPAYREKDFLVEYVNAGNYPGYLDSDEIILIWDETGGTSWVNPSIYKGPHGEPMIDIVYSAWGWHSHFNRFKQEANARLKHLTQLVRTQPGVHVEQLAPVQTVTGMIRSQPGPVPLASHSYAVGEAAGIAKPKSGESFNRSLLHGTVTARAIDANKNPRDVYTEIRKYWPNDERFLSIVLARLRYQEQARHSHLMDQLGKMHKRGIVSTAFIKAVEQFVIDGYLSPRLFMMLSTNPSVVQLMLETVFHEVRLKIFGIQSVKRNWHLPNVNITGE